MTFNLQNTRVTLDSTQSRTVSSPSFDRSYALKKRIFAPSWWVEGLLLSLGTKESWYESFAAKRQGKTVVSSSKISPKHIVTMFWIWNELSAKIFSREIIDNPIKIHLSKFVSGTSADVQRLCKEIESLWISPLSLCQVNASRRVRSPLSRIGSVNLVHHAFVEHNVDGSWLSLVMSQNLHNLCKPLTGTVQSPCAESPPLFVSVNPVLFRSMGNRVSLKKIVNYLFFEYTKSNISESTWSSFPLQAKQLCAFHKENLSNAALFYDHGVFGWEAMAPPIKISELKRKQDAQSGALKAGDEAVTYFWLLSKQAKDALAMELQLNAHVEAQTFSSPSLKLGEATSHALINLTSEVKSSSSLFIEPPADELQRIRQEKEKVTVVLKKEQSRKGAVKKVAENSTPVAPANPTLFAEVERPKPLSQAREKQVEELTENEFIVLVAEFYESLKPAQKKAFERERLRMSTAQFRSYMNFILQRRLMQNN